MMRLNRNLVAAVLIVTLSAFPVAAQEHSHVALDLGYPAALAVLWCPSAHFSLRPEFSFSYSGGGQNPTTWTVAPGLSVLGSIHSAGALTPYAGARAVGLWIKAGPGPEQWSAGPVVGARFALQRHFGVSAETGVAYTRLRFRFGPVGLPVPADVWSVAPSGRVSALLFL